MRSGSPAANEAEPADPLITRMYALRAEARRLEDLLFAEARERVALPAGSIDRTRASFTGGSRFELVVELAAEFERIPADPAAAAWALLAPMAMNDLVRIWAARRLDECVAAGFQMSDVHEYRIVEGESGFVAEAVPRALIGGRSPPWLRIEEGGEVRAEWGRRPTAESPKYALEPQRDAAGRPSAYEAAVRTFEREARALDRDLCAVMKIELFEGDEDAALAALEPDFEAYLVFKRDPEAGRAQGYEGRKRAHETAAIGALRTLTTAQALFREGDKDGDGVLDYAASLPATAEPLEPRISGDRYFFIDESGVIRFSTSGPTGAESVPIGG